MRIQSAIDRLKKLIEEHDIDKAGMIVRSLENGLGALEMEIESLREVNARLLEQCEHSSQFAAEATTALMKTNNEIAQVKSESAKMKLEVEESRRKVEVLQLQLSEATANNMKSLLNSVALKCTYGSQDLVGNNYVRMMPISQITANDFPCILVRCSPDPNAKPEVIVAIDGPGITIDPEDGAKNLSYVCRIDQQERRRCITAHEYWNYYLPFANMLDLDGYQLSGLIYGFGKDELMDSVRSGAENTIIGTVKGTTFRGDEEVFNGYRKRTNKTIPREFLNRIF
jgi:hypothetical protein